MFSRKHKHDIRWGRCKDKEDRPCPPVCGAGTLPSAEMDYLL